MDPKYLFHMDSTQGYTEADLTVLNAILTARMAEFSEIEGEEDWHEALKFNRERTQTEYDSRPPSNA
jgi:hypothetical protein